MMSDERGTWLMDANLKGLSARIGNSKLQYVALYIFWSDWNANDELS